MHLVLFGNLYKHWSCALNTVFWKITECLCVGQVCLIYGSHCHLQTVAVCLLCLAEGMGGGGGGMSEHASMLKSSVLSLDLFRAVLCIMHRSCAVHSA